MADIKVPAAGTGFTISDDIFARCVPTASVDASLCDGFNFENIKPTTQSDLETIYTASGQARLVGTLLEPDIMGVACQRKRNGLADIIRATARLDKKMSVSELGPGQYEIMPFLKMGVVNPINNNTWIFTNGTAAGTTETTPNTAESFTWKGTVTSSRGIPPSTKWFNPRTTVTIHSRTAGGIVQFPVYKVLDSVLDGATLTVYLLNISAHAADPAYALGASIRGNPVQGILTRGLASVHPEESFCDQPPALNMNQIKLFWIGGTRRSFCVDERVQKLLQLVSENNALYHRYGQVPEVQQLKQAAEDYDNRIVDSFLFGSALANQTLSGYGSLRKITYPGGDANSATFHLDGKYVAYEASPVGLIPQLAECEDEDGTPAYVDLSGAKVDIQSLKQWLWRLSQIRKSIGKNADAKIIRCIVHSQFREVLVNAFIKYFKAKSDDTMRINFDPKDSGLGFTYTDIRLDFPSVTLRLMSEDGLDDWLDDFKLAGNADNFADADFYKAGTLMLFLEWSTIYRAILEAGKVSLESGTPQDRAKVDDAFMCGPLRAPKKRVDHWWEIYTNVVECPIAQKVIAGFDDTEVLQTPIA